MLPRAGEEIIRVRVPPTKVLQLTPQSRKDSPPTQNTLTLGSETIPAKQTQGPFLPSRTSTASAILVQGGLLGV